MAMANSDYSIKKLTVTGIDRALFQGSFVVKAYATVPGADADIYLGHESILSRGNVGHSANPLPRQEVVVHFLLSSVRADAINDQTEFRLEFVHRGGTDEPEGLSYEFEVLD